MLNPYCYSRCLKRRRCYSEPAPIPSPSCLALFLNPGDQPGDPYSLSIGWLSSLNAFTWELRRGNPSNLASLPVIASGQETTPQGSFNIPGTFTGGTPFVLMSGGTVKYVVYPDDNGISGVMNIVGDSITIDLPIQPHTPYYYALYFKGELLSCGEVPANGIIYNGVEAGEYLVLVNGGTVEIPPISPDENGGALIWFTATPSTLELSVRADPAMEITAHYAEANGAGLNWVLNGGSPTVTTDATGSFVFPGTYTGPVVVRVNDAIQYNLETQGPTGQSSIYLDLDMNALRLTQGTIGLAFVLMEDGTPLVTGNLAENLVVLNLTVFSLKPGATYSCELNGGLFNVESFLYSVTGSSTRRQPNPGW
jgi:hypothetical protein